MAVPKKRKKLAETAEDLKKKSPSEQAKKKARISPKALTRSSSKKIDKAFEIMEHIENDDESSVHLMSKGDTNILPEESKKSEESNSSFKRLGFRFHISLDAVMPEKKSHNGNQRKLPVNKSSLVDIGLTIPFFWKMPIIGGIAQKLVQNIKTLKF